MDISKFLKQWMAVMIIVMVTMAIIGFSMRIVFKQKELMPEQEKMVDDITEKVIMDALEVPLTYIDEKYSVDRRPKQWQIDNT